MFPDATNIFVVGRPRSGTTLIVRLFDSHPEFLTINSETIFYVRAEQLKSISNPEQKFLHLTGRPYDNNNKRPQDFANDIEPNQNWDQHKFYTDLLTYHPNPERCREQLFAIASAGPKAALQAVFALSEEAFPSDHRTRFLVEKTPEHEYHIERIRRDFPNSIFIHMIRDPFDVIASRSKGFKKRNYVQETLNWRHSIKIFVENKKKFPDRHFAIRFEDLTRHPQATMEKLAKLLDFNFSEVLLTPTDLRGRQKWKSHTHQANAPRDGVVDANLTHRNIEEDLKIDDIRTIGSWLGRAYSACGFERHKRYMKQFPPVFPPNMNKKYLLYLFARRVLIADFLYFRSRSQLI
ncbi:MAG: sulfotransferase [Alphaproteobacteria bacterium]|nr:sulfotransferase [Alphaproteobacteria bacterium]